MFEIFFKKPTEGQLREKDVGALLVYLLLKFMLDYYGQKSTAKTVSVYTTTVIYLDSGWMWPVTLSLSQPWMTQDNGSHSTPYTQTYTHI